MQDTQQSGKKDAQVAPSTVLASAAAGIVDLLKKEKIDHHSIIGRNSIKRCDLDNPLAELYFSSYCSMFEDAAKATRDPLLGLGFGASFAPKDLGALGYLALNSPTLLSGIKSIISLIGGHQSGTLMSLLEEGDICWLTYQVTDNRIVQRRQDSELSLAMFRNIFRQALGPSWNPLEVRFEHSQQIDGGAHSAILNAPVKFGRRTNAFAFRKSALQAAMPDPDPYIHAIVERFLRERTPKNADFTDIASAVRNEIRLHLADIPPTLPDIARVLSVSPPELSRQLGDVGVTYSDMVKAARQDLAIHYLKNFDGDLTEIAFLLGYSELSAFSRAFKNWTGLSPRQFRICKDERY